MSGSSTRPPELDIDTKWDRCIDTTLRRGVYGSLVGAAAAVVLFRTPATRSAALSFGIAFGLGSAYTDCAKLFESPDKPK